MSTYSAAKAAEPRVPPRIVLLPPSCYADDWPDKPTAPVAVGLRLLSQADISAARAEASRRAVAGHGEADIEGQFETYDDVCMAWAVARATTDPNEVTQPFLSAPEENIPLALTPEGIRFLWQHYERLHFESSPVVPVATDQDLSDLSTRLLRDEVSGLARPRQLQIRRLLAYCLAELGGPVEAADEDDGGVTITPAGFVSAHP